MRSLEHRAESHLRRTLPAVARRLGSGWSAGALALRGPGGRHLACHLVRPACAAVAILADVDDEAREPLRIEVASTARAETIAGALASELLPLYPPSTSTGSTVDATTDDASAGGTG